MRQRERNCVKNYPNWTPEPRSLAALHAREAFCRFSLDSATFLRLVRAAYHCVVMLGREGRRAFFHAGVKKCG